MPACDVKKRDGLARSGTYTLGEKQIVFPAVIDTDGIFSDLAGIHHANVPLAAGQEFAERYLIAKGESGQPVTIHPAVPGTVSSGDCVMVANWHTALANPRSYVEWLVAMKERTQPDTLWYAPGAALPSNVPILCYTGFDLFDFRAVDLKSAQGLFCLPEGEYPKDTVDPEVCSCEGCRTGDLRLHNRLQLTMELARFRGAIARGQVRELLEARARYDANHVGILRFLDRRYEFLEKRTPVARAVTLRANAAESMNRVEVRRFMDRVLERYIPPAAAEVAVLLPCSAKKPYSLSQSHRRFAMAVRQRAHELIVTSPLGLVPRELELAYPAMHYDVPVTGYWDREEKGVLADVLRRYFEKHRYRRVIAHLEGGALEVAEEAAAACGIRLEYSCRDHPTSDAALHALDDALAGERKMKGELLRGLASWQFGIDPDTKGIVVKGRIPELVFMRNRTILFGLDPGTGLLRPTMDGWEMMPTGYRVYIDDFIPEGDILAPGVTAADPAIREGDEVLVIGERVTATGRAAMAADEMERSSRGVAVRVRKVKRRQHP